MSDPEKKFVRETIYGQKRWNRKFVRKLLLCLCFAVVFGVISALTFCITKSRWEEKHPEESTAAPVTVFSEETSAEETTAAPSEETEESSSEEGGTNWNTIKKKVQEMIDRDKADLDDMVNLYSVRNHLADQVWASMVSVIVKQENVDWFDNVVSSQSETSGVIIANTGKEYLILMNSDILDASDSLCVTFNNGGSGDARLLGVDSIFGIAVVSVEIDEIQNGEKDGYPVIPFATGTCMPGAFSAVIGRPYGNGTGAVFGSVVSVIIDVPATDMLVRLYQTDIHGEETSCGIMVNTIGEMTGWITSKFDSNAVEDLLTGISLSDLKATIEKMSNGTEMAALGIRGKNITSSIAEENSLPIGIYISKCVSGGAADSAGIQSGDILTGLGDSEIHSFGDLAISLGKQEPGDEVDVTIQRNSREGYQEMHFRVVLSKR